jgi:murein endopeptidase
MAKRKLGLWDNSHMAGGAKLVVVYQLPNNEHIRKIEELAMQNDPCAQLDLALIYRDECNDYSTCRYWLRRVMDNETDDDELWKRVCEKASRSCRNYMGVPKDHGQDSLKDINYNLMAIGESIYQKIK